MIPADLLGDARVFSCREDLLAYVMPLCAPIGKVPYLTVAEVGVAYGGFTSVILDVLRPAGFHAFDTFTLHHLPIVFGSDPKLVFGPQTHWQYYRERFPQTTTWEGYSWEQLALVGDQFFDFAYLDAGHSYESVKKDIEQLKRVVKPGGIIMFDDYTNFDILAWEKFGVLQAVNEYIEEGHEVLGISLNPEGFHNIAVVN